LPLPNSSFSPFYNLELATLFLILILFLQSILALIILLYTVFKLSEISVDFNGVSEDFCALGTDGLEAGDFSTSDIASTNCLFLEILGGLTIGLGIILAIIQCFTCYLCGLGGILDLIFGFLGTGAWLAASLIVTDVYKDTIDEVPYSTEREAIMIMCWIEFGLFVFIVLNAFAKCCGSSKSKDSGAV